MNKKSLVFTALMGITLATSPMAFAGSDNSSKSSAQKTKPLVTGQQHEHSMSKEQGKQMIPNKHSMDKMQSNQKSNHSAK